MKRSPAILLTLTGLLLLPTLPLEGPAPEPALQESPSPLLIHGRWEGTISPVTWTYIERLFDECRDRNAEALLLELDTPGGLDTAMRDIIKEFLATEIPVIVYVHPGGARAASAGVFITMAAHIAVMTPGTNIGAAHPVAIGGEMDSTMVDKVTHDTAAYARSLARQRGRNEEWAEDAVRRSVSATAEEAEELNIVDLPQEMQRAIARQAEAERERRVKVIHAEGEKQASGTLAEAAAVLQKEPAAIQLRFLQTLTEISTEKSSTIVLPIPIDLLKNLMDISALKKGNEE